MIRLKSPAESLTGDPVDACCAEISGEFGHSHEATKSQLQGVEARLHERIREYFKARGNAELLDPSPFPRSKPDSKDPKTDGDRLFSRYRSGASTDKEIVAAAAAVQTEYCPYCGISMPLKPKSKSLDKDHVLPRSVYPEFSLLRVNLVVVCDYCNDAKLDQVFDSNQRWMFIHPYFDDFLEKRVIRAKVTVVAGTPQMKFEVHGDLSTNDKERLERHFKTLYLEDRYAGAPLLYLVETVETHRKYWVAHKTDVSFVRNSLREAGESLLKLRPNDPVGHMFIALAEVDDASLTALLGPRSATRSSDVAGDVDGTEDCAGGKT